MTPSSDLTRAAAPWERFKLLRVAHEVSLWRDGQIKPDVALHNIASFLCFAPTPTKTPTKRNKKRLQPSSRPPKPSE